MLGAFNLSNKAILRQEIATTPYFEFTNHFAIIVNRFIKANCGNIAPIVIILVRTVTY